MTEPAPEPPSLYPGLAPALRETLDRSLADRLAGAPGAEQNLMFGFPRPPAPPPRTVDEALDHLGLTAVSLLVRLFDRLARLDPSLGLWSEICWIRNQWWGGSAGIKVAYRDPGRMRARLDALGPREGGLARDTWLGALSHQGLSWRAAARLRLRSPDPPHCDTWREVSGLGREAVHVCVGKGGGAERDRAADDLHLDWMSPVKGVDPRTGRCVYDRLVGLRHYQQAITGRGAPVFPFAEIEARLQALRARGPLPEAVRGFEARWEAEKRSLAAAGEAGEGTARARLEDLLALAR